MMASVMKRAMPTLGDRLRHAREEKGLTQFQVAADAGMRPEVLNRIERGRSNAALASLHKLAPVLGLEINELVGLHASVATKPGVMKTAKAAVSGKAGKTGKVSPKAGMKGKKQR